MHHVTTDLSWMYLYWSIIAFNAKMVILLLLILLSIFSHNVYIVLCNGAAKTLTKGVWGNVVNKYNHPLNVVNAMVKLHTGLKLLIETACF